MPSVYELTEAQSRLLYLLERADDPDTPDDERDGYREEAAELADALAADVPDKLDALRAVFLDLTATADAQKAEVDRMAKRHKSTVANAARVKAYAEDLLRGHGSKVKTVRASYRLQASGKGAVVGPKDASAWVEAGWFRVTETPDRTAAREALEHMREAGEPWPDGFELTEPKESIRW